MQCVSCKRSKPIWLIWQLKVKHITNLRLQVFGLSILQGKPSPGMALLNLRFRNEVSVDLTASATINRPSPSGLDAQPMARHS